MDDIDWVVDIPTDEILSSDPKSESNADGDL